MTTTSVTHARENLYSLISSVVNNDDTVLITSKHGNAILVSETVYNFLMETIYLNSIPGMTKSIIDGGSTPLSSCQPLESN